MALFHTIWPVITLARFKCPLGKSFTFTRYLTLGKRGKSLWEILAVSIWMNCCIFCLKEILAWYSKNSSSKCWIRPYCYKDSHDFKTFFLQTVSNIDFTKSTSSATVPSLPPWKWPTTNGLLVPREFCGAHHNRRINRCNLYVVYKNTQRDWTRNWRW